MVEATLKERALPNSFAQRLLMFPFPRTEPEVEIADLPGERMMVRCMDAQCYFVPLVEGGMCDWALYDLPGGRLTGVNECRVVGVSRRGGKRFLRVWSCSVELEPEKRVEGLRERHYVVENATWREIDVKRVETGELVVSERERPGHPEDARYEPVPMNLMAGRKWGGFAGGEVAGVSEVRVGGCVWRCLKVIHGSQRFKTRDGSAAAYAEWYVANTGRTVFFRRFNGEGYAEGGSPRSFESLAGNIEVEYEGKLFRHSYDCIADVALEKVMG